MLTDESSLEPPAPAVSGESRYLTRLLVKRNKDRSDSSIPFISVYTDLEHEAERIDQDHKKNIQDKIYVALKLLTFRESCVLVQFWAACADGNRQLLKTLDQPFGFGVNDERLWSYRRDSEHRSFVLDKDHEEEDDSPAARVFRHELPEWTSDINSYTPKHFPQQECAIRCNLHGYLGLPVFHSNTRLCVGVLEVLTSTKYTSYAYEVQRIYDALETVDLITQQSFDSPFPNVLNEPRQNDFNKIYNILRILCDIHNLPLSQTWAVSQHSSFVAHEKVIKNSCSSFDTRCVGKVCMSRVALPYYVKNMRMWPFFKACKERHLEKSRGLVGKALLTHGSCFCVDVTRLSEEEYPLVHNARINGLSGCFAIFLHSVEAGDDYVLEFYVTPDIKETTQLQNLVETLKQNFELVSGFELGDSSRIQVVEPPVEDAIPLNTDPDTIQISSTKTTESNVSDMVASHSVSMIVNGATSKFASVSNLGPSKQTYLDKFANIVLDTEKMNGDIRKNENMISFPDVSMQKKKDIVTEAGEQSDNSKQGRKRKAESFTMQEVEKHVVNPLDQIARSLSVGESTMKHDLAGWPFPKQSKKTAQISNLNPSQISFPKKQRRSKTRFGFLFFVFLMVRVKRWSCLSKRHDFSGKWWTCGKHSYLPSRSNFLYLTTFMKLQLKQWRNKSSKRNAIDRINLPAVTESTKYPKYTLDPYTRVAESSLGHGSPKHTADNISDTKTVTVKASYKDDMIKFQFSASSGLLELEHEVARRIKLKSKRFILKYVDEEKDLILIACDADLYNLLGCTTNGGTIKLIIQTADY